MTSVGNESEEETHLDAALSVCERSSFSTSGLPEPGSGRLAYCIVFLWKKSGGCTQGRGHKGRDEG